MRCYWSTDFDTELNGVLYQWEKAGKISFGESLGRLGAAALRFCPSWFCFGPLLGRFWDHPGMVFGSQGGLQIGFWADFVPKMTFKSDFGLVFIFGCLTNQ